VAKIRITQWITLDESELEETFIQSAGPGGQNVNKVASAVQLRFHAAHSGSLPEDVRQRLRRIAGRKMTKDGVLILTARRFRTQERNRDDARARLIELIREAATVPAIRRPTTVPRAIRAKRGETKTRASKLKRLRARPIED
jgi:ribosome-associated protein